MGKTLKLVEANDKPKRLNDSVGKPLYRGDDHMKKSCGVAIAHEEASASTDGGTLGDERANLRVNGEAEGWGQAWPTLCEALRRATTTASAGWKEPLSCLAQSQVGIRCMGRVEQPW